MACWCVLCACGLCHCRMLRNALPCALVCATGTARCFVSSDRLLVLLLHAAQNGGSVVLYSTVGGLRLLLLLVWDRRHGRPGVQRKHPLLMCCRHGCCVAFVGFKLLNSCGCCASRPQCCYVWCECPWGSYG